MNKITYISPLSDEQKIEFVVKILNAMDKKDFKFFMTSRKVEGRTAIYNGFAINWNTWYNLADNQRQIYINEHEARKKILSAELLTKVDFKDLLLFFCTKYTMSNAQNIISSLDFPVEISFTINSILNKNNLLKESNQPLIQFKETICA